jgi:hypothetical protein
MRDLAMIVDAVVGKNGDQGRKNVQREDGANKGEDVGTEEPRGAQANSVHWWSEKHIGDRMTATVLMDLMKDEKWTSEH